MLRFVTFRKKQFPVATCYEMYNGTWCLTPVAYTVAHCYVQCFVLLRHCSVTSFAVFRMCSGVLTTAFFTQCHFIIGVPQLLTWLLFRFAGWGLLLFMLLFMLFMLFMLLYFHIIIIIIPFPNFIPIIIICVILNNIHVIMLLYPSV